MGKVPAPGRSVKTVTGGDPIILRAADEGVCPDGYQAVLTVTPNSFEMGKVLMQNKDAIEAGSAIVQYNFGYLDFSTQAYRDITSMIQAGTRLGITTEPEIENGQIQGWNIAMGTITPTGGSGDGDYIWNFGGVPTNSWTAVAHTYCYFNPERFTMPNMRIDEVGGQKMLQTRDNPLIENNQVRLLE